MKKRSNTSNIPTIIFNYLIISKISVGKRMKTCWKVLESVGKQKNDQKVGKIGPTFQQKGGVFQHFFNVSNSDLVKKCLYALE